MHCGLQQIRSAFFTTVIKSFFTRSLRICCVAMRNPYSHSGESGELAIGALVVPTRV